MPTANVVPSLYGQEPWYQKFPPQLHEQAEPMEWTQGLQKSETGMFATRRQSQAKIPWHAKWISTLANHMQFQNQHHAEKQSDNMLADDDTGVAIWNAARTCQGNAAGHLHVAPFWAGQLVHQ